MAKRRPSGDGMVRKREDGRWEGRIVVGHKDNGDSIFRYVYADTQKELTARLRKCITAYQGVDLTEQSRLTLSEWLDQWLVSKEGLVRPGTLNGYRGYIENHIRPCLGEKRISQIKAVDIQRFYDMLSRKLASGTVRRIHTTLHGILKAAAQARLIPRNPVEEVTPPKFSYQEKKVLTAEQVREYPSCLRRPLSLLQQHRKAGRQGDRPCPRVGLGIACGKALALLPAHRAADFQGSIRCIEVLPPQAAQLAPAQAGGKLCVEEVMP